MKKSRFVKIFIIFMVLLINMMVNSYAIAKEYYLGDINQDGKVDITDELMLLRHICAVKTGKQEKWLFTQDELVYGDIAQNNEIDLTDVLYIKRYINRICSTFRYNTEKRCRLMESIFHVLF